MRINACVWTDPTEPIPTAGDRLRIAARSRWRQAQDCAAFDRTWHGTVGLPTRFVNRKAEALSALSAMLETITDVPAFTEPSHAVVGRC